MGEKLEITSKVYLSLFIPKYIKGKINKNEVVYTCDRMEPILKNTYGCIIYQEQVMQIVRDLAGYTLGRSDLVRKAMSKKKADVMEKERKNFVYGNEEEGVKGCVANGISEDVANKVFDEMTDFAKYAFNKAHSTCYAQVAYQTAYLKYYHPVEFMAALMNSVIENTTKVTEYIMTCKSMNIEILPPDINESDTEFIVKDNAIRYGLSAIKSVGKNVVNSIVSEREAGGKFKNLPDFIERVIDKEVNKRAIEAFIKAGACDTFDGNRQQKMLVYTSIADNITQSRKKSMAGQMTLFDIVDDDLKEAFEIKMPNVGEYKKEELLSFEKEFVGHYISGHPMEEYQTKWKKNATRKSSEFKLLEDGSCAVNDGAKETVGGIISDVTIKTTRNNKMMAFFNVEDMFGNIEVMVFPGQYEKYRYEIAEDAKVFVKGRVTSSGDEDAKIICESITKFEDMSADLWIRFENMQTFEEKEKILLDAVKDSDGKDRIVVYVVEEKKKKIYPPAYNIDANPLLIEKLKQIFGDANVVLS